MKLLSVCAFLIFLSTKTKATSDQCNIYTFCTTCIENADCAWKTRLDGIRCVSRRSTEMHSEDFYDPHNQLTFISNKEISDEIHISPQLVRSTLRPNSKTTFHVRAKKLSKLMGLNYTPSQSDIIKVSFETNWNNPNQEITKNYTNTDNMNNFEVILEAKTCSDNQLNFEEQTIQITQYANDQPLTINAQVLCSCPLEYSENSIKNIAVEKSLPWNRIRRKRSDCAEDSDSKNCINPDTGVECSGKGQCICGKCVCNQRPNLKEVVSGRYCECDNFSCPSYEGRLCNGEGRGKCVCNRCVCLAGWTNYKCSCSTNPETCKGPYSNIYCTENGACVCGKCECFEGFSGEYCQTKDQ